MHLPVDSCKLAVSKTHLDTAVNHGDQVGVGQMVENLPRSGSIYTRKDRITAERRPVAFRLRHTVRDGPDIDPFSGMGLSNESLSNLDLE